MEQIGKSNKCCATCAFWLGQKTLHRLGFIEVVSKTDSGRCGAKGLNESRTYQALYCCSNYCRLQLLK